MDLFWAVERKETKELIGFIGINPPNVGLDIEPCIEVGWRLRKDFGAGDMLRKVPNAY